MNIPEYFIRRPIATTLMAIAIFLAGVVAWNFLPVAPLPQVEFPTIQVTASLPGADPSTMASNVAQPLERNFAAIDGLSQMTSVSSYSTTQITLQFDLNKRIDTAALDVQTAINAASGQLPTNLPSPPTFRKVNPADAPIFIIGVSSATLPLIEVSNYTDSIIAQQISQMEGVGQVSVFGMQRPAVRVQIDPLKLAGLSMDMEDLRLSIGGLSSSLPKGTLDSPVQSISVYTNDQLFTAKDWNNAVVAFANGNPVRIYDKKESINKINKST